MSPPRGFRDLGERPSAPALHETHCTPVAEASQEPKAALRARIREALRSMDAGTRAEQATAIRAALRHWPRWVAARSVLAFLPLPSEVDLRPLLAEALASGVEVSVPESSPDGTFRPCRLRSLAAADLETDAMGIAVPKVRDPVPPERIEVVLVPGVAFDSAGRRLGRGGGFYDRFLARLPHPTATVGVCFGVQRVEQVPVDPDDIPVEWLAMPGDVVAAQPAPPI